MTTMLYYANNVCIAMFLENATISCLSVIVLGVYSSSPLQQYKY